jgi:GNAT superfamily N-acetyltransferase
VLGSLATHPDARGRGYASKLLKWGINEAERNGARIYLESTPMAHELYQRYGWHDTDEMRFILAEYGGEGKIILKTMIREPQTVQP